MSSLEPVTHGVSTYSEIPGLEDVSPTDLVMPILKVDHRRGTYVNRNSSEEFNELTAVLLGIVKQRVLWSPEIPDEDSSERPLCRSFNFVEGHPQYDKFPWEQSGFASTNNLLPCQACKLKEWDSHPSRSAPWCSEQHVYYMLQVRDDGSTTPLILYIQRSGLKDSRKYISSFFNEKRPLFFNYTTLALEGHKRGANPYYIPKFTRGVDTDPADHPNYSQVGMSIRQFLQTPFNVESDGDDPDAEMLESAPIPTPVASAPAPAPAPTAPTAPAVTPPTPTAASTDDGLPF